MQQYDPAFLDDYLHKDSTLLVDATRNDPPYNKNSYPSFDESYKHKNNDESSYSVDLFEAYPISVNQLDLDWSAEGHHKLTVVFAYTSWQKTSTYRKSQNINRIFFNPNSEL